MNKNIDNELICDLKEKILANSFISNNNFNGITMLMFFLNCEGLIFNKPSGCNWNRNIHEYDADITINNRTIHEYAHDYRDRTLYKRIDFRFDNFNPNKPTFDLEDITRNYMAMDTISKQIKKDYETFIKPNLLDSDLLFIKDNELDLQEFLQQIRNCIGHYRYIFNNNGITIYSDEEKVTDPSNKYEVFIPFDAFDTLIHHYLEGVLEYDYNSHLLLTKFSDLIRDKNNDEILFTILEDAWSTGKLKHVLDKKSLKWISRIFINEDNDSTNFWSKCFSTGFINRLFSKYSHSEDGIINQKLLNMGYFFSDDSRIMELLNCDIDYLIASSIDNNKTINKYIEDYIDISTLLFSYFVLFNYDGLDYTKIDLSFIDFEVPVCEFGHADKLSRALISEKRKLELWVNNENAPENIRNNKILECNNNIRNYAKEIKLEKRKVNNEIKFTHLRNSFAHGYYSVLYERGKYYLYIYDYDNNDNYRKTFETRVSFENLAKLFSNSYLLDVIKNNNSPEKVKVRTKSGK